MLVWTPAVSFHQHGWSPGYFFDNALLLQQQNGPGRWNRLLGRVLMGAFIGSGGTELGQEKFPAPSSAPRLGKRVRVRNGRLKTKGFYRNLWLGWIFPLLLFLLINRRSFIWACWGAELGWTWVITNTAGWEATAARNRGDAATRARISPGTTKSLGSVGQAAESRDFPAPCASARWFKD